VLLRGIARAFHADRDSQASYTPNSLVTSDSRVEQVAAIEDFAAVKVNGREFFSPYGAIHPQQLTLDRSTPAPSRRVAT